jgi:hypothetical protein
MNWREMAMEREGLYTLEGFSRAEGIKKSTATLYLHELRKRGFVRTTREKKGKRFYDVSPVSLREIGSKGFYQVLNENSPLKIREPFVHRVYGREMTIEEAIIEALKTRRSRFVLASLGLFRKPMDWNRLYGLAKREGLERHVGALYSLSRRIFRVRAADERILRRMGESRVKDRFMVPKIKSDDFKDIEEEWGVYIPFNRPDLEKLGASLKRVKPASSQIPDDGHD